MNTMKSYVKKGASFAIVLAITASTLTGCGRGSKKSTLSANEPYKLSMMNCYFSSEPPKPDDPVTKKIAEYTNTSLDISWIPKAAYDDKVAVMLASGDMPKVIMVISTNTQSIVNGAKSGMFWEIGPYLKDYPNLSTKLNKKILESVSIDGKLYGIYRSRPIARDAFIYRKDWLNTLGLKEPKTIDDLYNVIKAFTQNDPDKNGVNDTIGLADMKDIPYCVDVATWFGAPNGWREDGTPAFATDEYLQMLKWYRRLYQEKLINQDFAICEEAQRQNLFLSGKAGAKLHVLDVLKRDEEEELKKVDPKAQIDAVSLIEGPNGTKTRSTGGFGGIFMIPKSSVKTEDELKRILEYFDKCYDVKLQNLFKYGIEGIHYKVVDGKAVKIVDKIEDTTFNVMDQMNLTYDDAMPEGDLTKNAEKADMLLKEGGKLADYNPFLGLVSTTYNEKGNQLDRMIEDAKTKFIVGAIDENGWKQEIEKWRNAGGNKVVEEYLAGYELRNK